MAKLLRKTAVGSIVASVLLAAASSYAACTSADINGSAMPAGSHADRTITVRPNTKRLNVSYGETVKFVMPSGQETIWKFDGIGGKLTLGTVLASPSASEGSSAQAAAPATNIPIYVDQAKNPLTGSCGG